MKHQRQPQQPNQNETNPRWPQEPNQKGNPRPQQSPGARPEKPRR